MKKYLQTHRIKNLLSQRNMLLTGAAGLLASNIILVFFLFQKSDRIIVVPPEIKEQFWVEHHLVSPGYLQEWTLFFAHLLLDNHPGSIRSNNNIILRSVDPGSYTALKQQLSEEAEKYSNKQLITMFAPIKVDVDIHKMKAVVKGQFISRVGNRIIKQREDTYEFTYKYQYGKLLITSFTRKEEAHV
tara:strand:- start:15345 stop:15905 length:561 start_codon:yes stop_codon:yes gene_type:complete